MDDLYALVPTVACKGLCRDSCSSLSLTEAEAARIAVRHGVHLTTGVYPDGCPALTPFGHCGVYEDRPLVCRLWGVVAPMVCEHGCAGPDGLMAEADGRALAERLVARSPLALGA